MLASFEIDRVVSGDEAAPCVATLALSAYTSAIWGYGAVTTRVLGP
jgi:hypothetical protein